MNKTKTRQEEILEILGKESYRSVTWLSKYFDVSDMTIRRDLMDFEKRGLIRRTHGGALPGGKSIIELDFSVRQNLNLSQKKTIGKYASQLIKEGGKYFLDAGTTTLEMAKNIPNVSCFILTNSPPIAYELESRSNIKAILTGGSLRRDTNSLVGEVALEAISRFKVDNTFLGTGGIDLERGLTHSTMEEIPVKKEAARIAKEVIVVADTSKLGKDAFAFYLPFKNIHTLVTDSSIKNSDRKKLKNKGVKVLVTKGDKLCQSYKK